MTTKKDQEELREKKIELVSYEKIAKTSDKEAKLYKPLIESYRTRIQDLEDLLTPKRKNAKPEYWTPESKGKITEIDFDRPYLSVAVHKTITERPTGDAIRRFWIVKNDRCEHLVEEKGYIVGVIENVVVGVFQVSGWKIIKEGEHEGRVEFEGELLSDHPSIDFTLKDRNVSGPIQYFNFPDDWTDS